MTATLNQILNEALPRWAALTGMKLGARSFKVKIGDTSEFRELDLKLYLDDLNEARSRDVSGTTAILILRGLFENYVSRAVVQRPRLVVYGYAYPLQSFDPPWPKGED